MQSGGRVNSCYREKEKGPAGDDGPGTQIGERWHDAELAAIDAWIAASFDKTMTRARAIRQTMTRARAIRQLVELGLKAKGKS